MGEGNEPAWQVGAGRRDRSPEGRRAKVVKVRMDPAEYDRYSLMAANLGISIQRLLVESTDAVNKGTTMTERRELSAELLGMRRLLAGIANNINQIAKAANSGQAVKDDAHATFDSLRRLNDRMREVLTELGGR